MEREVLAEQKWRSIELGAQSPRLLATLSASTPAENLHSVRTGGGSATGIQRSPNLECPNFHMGARLGSNSCIENTAKFNSEKIGMSLGSGKEPSNDLLGGRLILPYRIARISISVVSCSAISEFAHGSIGNERGSGVAPSLIGRSKTGIGNSLHILRTAARRAERPPQVNAQGWVASIGRR